MIAPLPPTLESAVRRVLQERLGSGGKLHAAEPVSGGDINRAAVIQTNRGDFFIKWNDNPPPLLFEAEAESLKALKASGTSLKIPEVLGESAAGEPAFLLLEYLQPSGFSTKDYEKLGEGLAQLHRKPGNTFGFSRDTYCGVTLQKNSPMEQWSQFYRDRRLAPLVKACGTRRGWTPAEDKEWDRLLDRVEGLLENDEPPALIHGDLWSGNAMATLEGPSIFDPAAYCAHREAEFGMMTLFGGFPESVYKTYRHFYPLSPGWEERLPLYQLYHLLNHYLLFGGGYGASALSIARRYG